MARLDASTLTEYDAETTASARAQAVIDALSGTVTFNIRNGSDTVMATGTMASPWATESQGVITIGELASAITVDTGGTPDADWYIEFSSGSRWVTGTFGLAGSGAEFTWSLATFEAAQTATLGSVALTSVTNSAPQWLAAPDSLTRTAGSQEDFSSFVSDPDGDTLAFSLVSPPAGYSINSSTGVLTIGSVSGAVTIRSTDGVLYADHVCTVTISSGTEYPGVVLADFEGTTVGAISYVADDPNWNWINQNDSQESIIVSTPARSGTRAVRSNANRYYRNGILILSGEKGQERCEIRWANPVNLPVTTAVVSGETIYVGSSEWWWGYSLYIPSSFKPAYNRNTSEAMEPIFSQLHRTPDSFDPGKPDSNNNPSHALKIIGNGAGVPYWYVRADKIPGLVTNDANKTTRNIACGIAQTGEWTDWVFCAYWHTVSGYFKAWKKDSTTSGAFSQVVDVTGGYGYADIEKAPYIKIGVYMPIWDNRTVNDPALEVTEDINGNEISQITVYHDEFRWYAGNLSDADGIAYVRPR